jgi:hypothetical protein
MNTIQPSYVNFNTAKWLKEKEYDVATKEYFDLNNTFTNSKQSISMQYRQNWNEKYSNKECTKKELISRPEQWQVVEWLRVNHGIWISVNWYNKNNNNIFWSYTIEKIVKYPEPIDYTPQNTINSNTPQEAYSAAFDYIKENNLI